MYLNYITSADIQHLQKPDQLFAFADAYRSAAATMCQDMTSDAMRSTWPNATVVLMLTAHAVELFLKGALLKRNPVGSIWSTHNIEVLSAKYRLQFPGPSFEWDIPFGSGLKVKELMELIADEFPSLTNNETEAMRKELEKKQKARPAPSILYRYPIDNFGVEWRHTEGFEPHSFLSQLDQIENDFRRIKSNLA